jgi:hypothetical protein
MKFLLGLVGAAIGGTAGYFAFGWVLQQGLYAIALPGFLLGLGAGLLSRQRSLALPIVCGVAALALGLYTEWHYLPFTKDASFTYFLLHFGDLRPATKIMLVLGAACGFWFALGNPGKKPPFERDESKPDVAKAK